ncbi:hypothetical protein [Comamonas testosteroni]|uniref:hypothetical protein n=1 Tax=Comamonas testosteroni TaxID=285 RepID=UPI0005B34CB5|nr:hypothetical protein [Comamonas testosteroni]
MNLLTLVLKLPNDGDEKHQFEKALSLLEPHVVARDNRDLFSVVNLIETHPEISAKVLSATRHQVKVINSSNNT